MKTLLLIASLVLAGASGAAVQNYVDHAQIAHARQNEMQANGLEDECKAVLRKRR